jgi:hypothetical protein
MKYITILFTLTLCFTSAIDSECILLSFPRSGNTFIRYCIEALTKRPTTSLQPTLYPGDRPLGKTFRLNVDFSKPYVIKAHQYNQNNYLIEPNQPLIFLIRNPKECMISHYATITSMFHENKYYFDNIKKFNDHNGEKILIYYEDLITNPKPELKKLLYFLSDDENNDQILEDFMQDFQSHKNNAKLFYQTHMKPEAHSSGESLIFYSKNFSKDMLRGIDREIQLQYPKIWEKYLIRYKES